MLYFITIQAVSEGFVAFVENKKNEVGSVEYDTIAGCMEAATCLILDDVFERTGAAE